MNIFSFLISFVFLKVSTYNIINYMQDLVITNEYIEVAYSMNNITTKDNVVVANGLEHVIKQIVKKSQQGSLGVLNNMFTQPDYRLDNDWNVCKEKQTALRDEIQNELEIAVPQIEDKNFRKFNLKSLAAKRRSTTTKALKNILDRAINYDTFNLIHESILLDTEAFENRITQTLAGPEEEISLLMMCHLIALFMNTKSCDCSWFYIKETEAHSDDTCYMLYNDGSTTKTYRKIEGQWCEVNIHTNFLQPLKEQLL
ncbi:uncharacterized protein LOC126836183 [Adelges cooleyi]|uniref:uncharacterized protein LOC126836183 n=1 Tax=Adelges cooleyi TaxID=133065 RepID=UPI00217F2AB5|nr:uncharacterized protein LOC126836183 [Adelges cooleyi]